MFLGPRLFWKSASHFLEFPSHPSEGAQDLWRLLQLDYLLEANQQVPLHTVASAEASASRSENRHLLARAKTLVTSTFSPKARATTTVPFVEKAKLGADYQDPIEKERVQIHGTRVWVRRCDVNAFVEAMERKFKKAKFQEKSAEWDEYVKKEVKRAWGGDARGGNKRRKVIVVLTKSPMPAPPPDKSISLPRRDGQQVVPQHPRVKEDAVHAPSLLPVFKKPVALLHDKSSLLATYESSGAVASMSYLYIFIICVVPNICVPSSFCSRGSAQILKFMVFDVHGILWCPPKTYVHEKAQSAGNNNIL